MVAKLRELRKLGRIYGHLVRMWAQTEFEYRQNFFVNLLGEFLWTLVFLTFLEVIFNQVTEIAGWSRLEVLLIYGIARVTKEVAGNLLFENLTELPIMVNKGDLDKHLLKPLSVRFIIAFSRIQLVRVLSSLAGAAIAVLAWRELGLAPDLGQIALAVLLLAIMIANIYGIIFSFMCLSFKLGDIHHGFHIYNDLSRLAQMPPTAFAGGWYLIFNHLLPVVLFGALPAAALLGRFDLRLLPIYLATAVFWLWFSGVAWRWGLRNYTSVG